MPQGTSSVGGPAVWSGNEPVVALDTCCASGWLAWARDGGCGGSWSRSPAELAIDLRQRIATLTRIPLESIYLADNVDRTLRSRLPQIPAAKIAFPPSASASLVSDECVPRECITLCRGIGADGSIELETAIDIPTDGVAYIDSPSDPLGSILFPAEAVRLARACRLLIVDERHGEFSSYSLRGLATEFDNVVIVRGFDKWLGSAHPACGWVIGSPGAVQELGVNACEVDAAALAAATALLDDLGALQVAGRLLRQERSRLYRLLRKYSFLQPVPSWGPFLAARTTVVQRDDVVRAFSDRGIRVHAPQLRGLEDFLRISVGPRSAMEQLRLALLDMAPELLA
jgi:Aminotransferase class I and II